MDLLMHFTLSRELFIANALSRHFEWSNNILFVEDLDVARARYPLPYTDPPAIVHPHTRLILPHSVDDRHSRPLRSPAAEQQRYDDEAEADAAAGAAAALAAEEAWVAEAEAFRGAVTEAALSDLTDYARGTTGSGAGYGAPVEGLSRRRTEPAASNIGADDGYLVGVAQRPAGTSGKNSPLPSTSSSRGQQRTSTRNGCAAMGPGPGSGGRVRHSIFLSSHDAIVPVGPVSRYLEAKSRQAGLDFFEVGTHPFRKSVLDLSLTFYTPSLAGQVVLFHGTHGEMFVYPRWVDLIAGKIKERCGLVR
jgi:hypothetical protein